MSAGLWRMLVIPEEWSSFQNRFEGCAYANPVIPVIIPGFTPTRRMIRFGGMVSRSRDSVAVGPWVGVGVGVLRLRLFGADVEVDRERVGREIVVEVVCVAAFLRFGLDVAVSDSSGVFVSSDLILDWPIAVDVFWVSRLPLLCRNCCSLPWKLVSLFTGTSSWSNSDARLPSVVG